MQIVEYGLYNIKDDYFTKYKDKFLPDNKQEKRPYYVAVRDSGGIIWMVPLSSKVPEYKAKIKKDAQKHGSCLFYHIGIIAGVERVFLVGNMFPVTESYLKKQYTISGVHYVVQDTVLIREIHKRVSRYLTLVKYQKLKPNVDILKIRNDLLK